MKICLNERQTRMDFNCIKLYCRLPCRFRAGLFCRKLDFKTVVGDGRNASGITTIYIYPLFLSCLAITALPCAQRTGEIVCIIRRILMLLLFILTVSNSICILVVLVRKDARTTSNRVRHHVGVGVGVSASF